MASAAQIKSEFSKLSIGDQLDLLYELWDTLAQRPEALILSEDQQRELDRRYERHLAHPEEAIPWDAVRDRIRRSRSGS